MDCDAIHPLSDHDPNILQIRSFFLKGFLCLETSEGEIIPGRLLVCKLSLQQFGEIPLGFHFRICVYIIYIYMYVYIFEPSLPIMLPIDKLRGNCLLQAMDYKC